MGKGSKDKKLDSELKHKNGLACQRADTLNPPASVHYKMQCFKTIPDYKLFPSDDEATMLGQTRSSK